MDPGSHVGFQINTKNTKQVNLKQTWHEWSLGGQLSKLCPVTQTSIQDGRHQRT
jgi:hypothetical protein